MCASRGYEDCLANILAYHKWFDPKLPPQCIQVTRAQIVSLSMNVVSFTRAESQIQEVAQFFKVLICEDMPKSISSRRGTEGHDVDSVRHVHVQSGAAVVEIIPNGSQRGIDLGPF
jgi:hypothetical protein